MLSQSVSMDYQFISICNANVILWSNGALVVETPIYAD